MPLATFLSDYGLTDHYVAAVKARIFRDCPKATVVDITHHIGNGNIAQAGYCLRSVFRDFPKGTVHLVAVGAASDKKKRFLVVEMEGHFFVGPDNGVCSLISDEEPERCVLLPTDPSMNAAFPGKFVLAPTVAELLNGTKIEELGEPCKVHERKLYRQLSQSANAIQGHIIHIDHYGNLITNIDSDTFNELRRGRRFAIRFGYERFNAIYSHYNSKEYGDCVMLFNSQNLLEIAINQGNAAQLLGLNLNSSVAIDFEVEVEEVVKQGV